MKSYILAILALVMVGSFFSGAMMLNITLPKEPLCFPAKVESLTVTDPETYTYEESLAAKEDFSNNGYILSEGESMEPTIPDGAICKCIVTQDYDVNDIVVFRLPVGSGYKLVDHRVIDANSTYLITQGDNNPEPDGLISLDDVYCEIPQVTPFEKLLESMIIGED